MIGTGGSGGLTDGVNGNIVGVANITTVLETTLAVNGTTIQAGAPSAHQPVLTHVLVSGSQAIDVVDNSLIPSGVTTVQRGLPRIVNGTVDIGAFEVQ